MIKSRRRKSTNLSFLRLRERESEVFVVYTTTAEWQESFCKGGCFSSSSLLLLGALSSWEREISAFECSRPHGRIIGVLACYKDPPDVLCLAGVQIPLRGGTVGTHRIARRRRCLSLTESTAPPSVFRHVSEPVFSCRQLILTRRLDYLVYTHSHRAGPLYYIYTRLFRLLRPRGPFGIPQHCNSLLLLDVIYRLTQLRARAHHQFPESTHAKTQHSRR